MSKRCLGIIISIFLVYILIVLFDFYQIRRIRKMIPKYKIGDILIDNLYEGFSDDQLIQCIYYMNFLKDLTLSSFLGSEANSTIPEFCKVHHNQVYQNISKAIEKITPKDRNCSLITEYKDGINYFYCEITFTDSDFENIIKNNYNYDNKVKYDDEIEQYYNKSRKDCVEYGLKSSKEEIIVCTKYE